MRIILNKYIHFVILVILTSCLSEQTITPVQEINQETVSNSNEETNQDTVTNAFTENNNFIQQGSIRSLSTLGIFSDYQDSILLRGNNIIDTLKASTQTTQNNYCIVTKFPNVADKQILIMSAKIRSYYSQVLKLKEYFLQIEPNNKELNQNDCLSIGLTTKLTTEYGTSNFSFSINEVCPDCNTNLTSSSLRAFSSVGVEDTNLEVSNLFIGIIPAPGSSSGSNQTCSIDETCQASNFNCCLAGQCVNHGEVKSTTNTNSDKYTIALQILSTRPELLNNYSDLFYVCPSMISNDGGDDDVDTSNPQQEASDLFTELTDLYNCTTPVIDEFSICKKDYNNASDLMSSSPHSFLAENDDITFSSINPSLGLTPKNNISMVTFAGKTIYKEQLYSTDEVILNSDLTFSSSNDSLSTAQNISMQLTLPSDASNNIVSIYYKIDGTCEKLGSSLARCKKYYVQGQSSSPVRSSDHSSGNNSFAVPAYLDPTFNLIVEVGGSRVPKGVDTWQLVGNNIVFNDSSFPVFDNQEVVITYFVSNNVSNLTKSKELAQERINDHCKCSSIITNP